MGREVPFLLCGGCRDVRGAFYGALLYPLLDCIPQATAEGCPGNERRGPERELVHYPLCLGGQGSIRGKRVGGDARAYMLSG